MMSSRTLRTGTFERWQTILLAVFLASAWLVSDHYPPWTGFHSELPALLAGAVAVVSALVTAEPSPRVSRLAVLLLILGTVPWVQFLAQKVNFAGDAIVASLYLFGTGLCLWAGRMPKPETRTLLLHGIAAAMLTTALVSTGIAGYQWFGAEGLGMWVANMAPGGRSGGNLAQPNHLATALCFGLATLALLRATGRIGTVVAAVAAAFIVCGLALTQSRTPWLMALLVAVWLAVRRVWPSKAFGLPAPLLVGMFAWYALAFWATTTAMPMMLADEGGQFEARLGAGTRPALWGQALAAIGESPLTGYGWMQGDTAQAMGAMHIIGHEYTGGFAHNLGLDLMIWNGVPLGTLLLVFFLAWYVSLGLRAEGPVQWFRFVVISLLAAHAMVEYPYAYAYFLVPLGILGGQFEADAGASSWRVSRPLLAVLTLGCIAASVAIVHDYFLLESDLREMRFRQLRIGEVRRTEPPRDVWVLDQLLGVARAARIDVGKDMPAADLAELLKVTRRFNTRFFLHQTALALALQGRAAEAELQMRRLLGIYGPDRYRHSLASMEEIARDQYPEILPLVATWSTFATTPKH